MTVIRKNLTLWCRSVQTAVRRHASTNSGSSTSNSPQTGTAAKGKEEVEADESGEEVWERRVVSGLQPTGVLHVGNYFGALRRCVRAQQAGDDLTLFIADLHALTTHQGGPPLQERTLELTALALAAGVEPGARAALFAQSAVARHSELCWVLACLCSRARVQHLPQYREKAAAVPRGGGAGDGAEVPLGLLLYPVLQAADVLVYRGTHVPVGADQLQHLQLAAQLVRTFHHRYGRAFPVPRAMLADDGSDRLRSLRDPSRKMSKSDKDTRGAIWLTDSDQAIREKIRKAVTDCSPHVSFEPEARPGVANLVALHCLAADKLPAQVVADSAGLTTAQYKDVVAEALCTALRPLRAGAARWRARPRALRDVLAAGAARARPRADRTYRRVQQLVGLAPAGAALDAHPLHAAPRQPGGGDAEHVQSGRN